MTKFSKINEKNFVMINELLFEGMMSTSPNLIRIDIVN